MKGWKFYIDPGHGGKDNGAQGRIYTEKDLNLQIARRLKDVLRAKGYIVSLTRDKDVFIELEDRSGKASAMKAAPCSWRVRIKGISAS